MWVPSRVIYEADLLFWSLLLQEAISMFELSLAGEERHGECSFSSRCII